MGRFYKMLDCGCLVSCDAGGGMAADCEKELGCKFDEWVKEHTLCQWCGYCLKCQGKEFHKGCREMLKEAKKKRKELNMENLKK